MGTREPGERSIDTWQHVLVAIALALPTLSALSCTNHGIGWLAPRLGLVGTLAAWYAYWFVVRRSGPATLPYLAGAAALWAVMVAVEPALLAVGAAMVIPYCLRRVLYAGVLFVAIAVGWLGQRELADRSVNWSAVLTCALGVLTAIAVAGYITTLHREARRRQRLLDELATAQAELAVAERRAGILTERQRLARDIHDTLTQGFASIALLLDSARDDLPPGGPASTRVAQAARTARENLVDSRRLISALRPSQLDGVRLPDAVRRLTTRLAEETDIAAHTVITGQPAPLAAGVESQLLRVIQEALTNARRHAAASEVTVTLSYMDEMVLVDVQDNGTGIRTDAPPAGIGLASMLERVHGLGGTLIVESAPGEGTTVALSVPVSGA